MKTLINRFLKDESGATAIEYGLIAALLSVAIITALGNVKNSLNNTYDEIQNALDNAKN